MREFRNVSVSKSQSERKTEIEKAIKIIISLCMIKRWDNGIISIGNLFIRYNKCDLLMNARLIFARYRDYINYIYIYIIIK